MPKDDSRDRIKLETTETNGKIADAYEKLATRFRERARKADAKSEAANKKGKREALRRRSELFGKSAKDLDGKVAKLRKAGA